MQIPPTCSELTGHCWHSPHISRWAGWSVCSIVSRSPPQPRGRSYRTLPSRSSRVGRSGTSEPPGGSDRTADRDGSRTTGVGPAALEEWSTRPSLLLWCTSPHSPTSPQDLVPMETTGSRQCGTETELRRLSHSSLCSPVSSSSLVLLSLLIYY